MFWGEPDEDHQSSSHYDPSDRWDTLATELGREVLSICPRWLLFVQGVGQCRVEAWPCELPSAPGHQDLDMQAGIWWASALRVGLDTPPALLP
jgi:hypothetical protein